MALRLSRHFYLHAHARVESAAHALPCRRATVSHLDVTWTRTADIFFLLVLVVPSSSLLHFKSYRILIWHFRLDGDLCREWRLTHLRRRRAAHALRRRRPCCALCAVRGSLAPLFTVFILFYVAVSVCLCAWAVRLFSAVASRAPLARRSHFAIRASTRAATRSSCADAVPSARCRMVIAGSAW